VFGLEDETVQQNQTAEGIVMGTLSYMSPEQARAEKVDERADIFSLGAVLYEMVTGTSPFAADSMSEKFANLLKADPPAMDLYRHGVPGKLETVVEKMLRKNREERPRSMREVVDELKSVARAPQTTSPQNTISNHETVRIEPQATGSSIGRRPMPVYWIVAAAAAVVLIGAAGYYGFVYKNASSTTEAPASASARSPAYDLFLRGKVKLNSGTTKRRSNLSNRPSRSTRSTRRPGRPSPTLTTPGHFSSPAAATGSRRTRTPRSRSKRHWPSTPIWPMLILPGA
jgi:serine/threonine protein kinase